MNKRDSMNNIVIIDYGMGNLRSVSKAINFLGYSTIITENANEIDSADAIILPGVGAFGQAMKNLSSLHIIPSLTENVIIKKKPFLGICLGMQLIALDSTEMGNNKGLGWLDAKVEAINADNITLPHVGWNDIKIVRQVPLFHKLNDKSNFYFDHTYHFICDESYVSSYTFYGINIVSSIQKDNIFATQFHPEKSQTLGLKLIRNFLNFCESKAKAEKC